MDLDLTSKLRQKMKPYPRTRGRYNSSEIYSITHGFKGKKLTPEEWFHASEMSVKQILPIWAGMGQHAQLEKLMGAEYSEKKVEFVYKDVVLVAKADFLPPHVNEVWEWKTSEKLMTKSKIYHDYQVKLYLSIFDRPIGRIYQPVQNADGLYLKELGVVERDDVWFEAELEKLYIFHQEVEKLWKQQENLTNGKKENILVV